MTSPAYILENPNGTTLCIPTAFVSWTGEASTKRRPSCVGCRRSNKQAHRILKLFGHNDEAFVASTAGPEQEYFLIDRNFYFSRPDLFTAGRTLFGAKPPKGQEFEDHYFGADSRACWPSCSKSSTICTNSASGQTRHNEVAPAQSKSRRSSNRPTWPPIISRLIMITLKRVAEKYGMACLTHEKPFAGVNGSGKHVNWSLGSTVAGQPARPGRYALRRTPSSWSSAAR